MNSGVIYGDAERVLKTLPPGLVQCCVTSPPYWGLRDYSVEGQFGLEKTIDEYIARMVETFVEVRRVLRDDGTVWLNLGDSYASSGRSARKESPGVGAKQAMQAPGPQGYKHGRANKIVSTQGWQPTCSCDNEGKGRCLVLDPFAGSGTTGEVALKHGRDYLLIELNRDYEKLIRGRLGLFYAEAEAAVVN